MDICDETIFISLIVFDSKWRKIKWTTTQWRKQQHRNNYERKFTFLKIILNKTSFALKRWETLLHLKYSPGSSSMMDSEASGFLLKFQNISEMISGFVCICKHMYTYVCFCVYVICIYVYIFICLSMCCLHMCIPTCTCYVYVCIPLGICIRTCMYIYVCICFDICIFMYVYIFNFTLQTKKFS